jgi:hypothetical protein
MKLFTPSLILLSLVPALAAASGGTLTFRGALVEPTCQSEVLDAAALPPGRVAVRLYDCRLTPTPPAQQAAHGASPHHITESAAPLTLSPRVAELAGRTEIDTLTFSYQ